MKQLLIKIILCGALLFGIGSFTPPEAVSATPAMQTSLTVHVGTAHGWHHHRRHHHRHW